MQVVGYDTGVGGLTYDPAEGVEGAVTPPALLIAAGGAVRREVLAPGTELSYTLGGRHCAGATDGDTHEPCDEDEAPYCGGHSSTWPCAQCTGECGLPLAACREEHAVYLAAFAPATFKVGVTRLHRLHARLREQGADRGAHVHSVSDGRIARRIEREIAGRIPDRVPVRAKVEGLHREVDPAAWRSLLSEFDVVDEMAFDYGLDPADRPVAETLATGTVVGAQGRLLVLSHAGGLYAVDLRDLVGYELDAGATDRDLQSRLGAFG